MQDTHQLDTITRRKFELSYGCNMSQGPFAEKQVHMRIVKDSRSCHGDLALGFLATLAVPTETAQFHTSSSVPGVTQGLTWLQRGVPLACKHPAVWQHHGRQPPVEQHSAGQHAQPLMSRHQLLPTLAQPPHQYS